MANRLLLSDMAATEALAARLTPHLQRGDMLALHGQLGAGKTAFARALLRALGVTGEVPSPTFTLVQLYDLPALSVAHFDLYRLRSAEELDELGWDDACFDGVTLVEWPERAAGRLPQDRLALHFGMDDQGGRCCILEPYGTWAQRLQDILP